jgi:cephalosporin hydroxylase
VTALDDFAAEVRKQIEGLGADVDLQALSRIWIREISRHRYTYNFEWLGRPIIQFPQDIVAVQELIWKVRPDVVVETGIAHGGSLILSASILELLGGEGRVIGVDIDIRPHNRVEIERHPLSGRITLVEGSSVDDDVVEQVVSAIPDKACVLVILDSSHIHAHVLEELRRYSPLVTRGSYLVVFDTIIDDMPDDAFPDRPWGPGDNPKTAVRAFLQENDRFVVDDSIEHKLLITVAPGGYLRCVADASTTRR